jgi:hypothetical protein
MSKQINEYEKYRKELENNPIQDAKNIWQKIEEFLYKKDKNGEWVRNENGKRVLAWERILLKVWVLIGLLVERIQQHENEQQGARGGELGAVNPDATKSTPPPATLGEAVLVNPDATKRGIEQPAEKPNKPKKNVPPQG